MDQAEKEATRAVKAAVIEMVRRRAETAGRLATTTFVSKGTDTLNRNTSWRASAQR
ncbi:MAG: hypothetical protein JSS27_04475 [Planctomycetes bacterium]|nr:hypothetical protein [Planctomycetota bacterium]